LGVIAASRELSHLRHDADPEAAELLLTFAGIDSETDALPIGKVRKEWNREALKSKAIEIAEAEQFYRVSAMTAAAKLIRLLDAPPSVYRQCSVKLGRRSLRRCPNGRW